MTISQNGHISDDVTLQAFTNNRLEINANAGADTFRIDDSLAGIVLAPDGQGDNDTILLCPTNRTLDYIDGDVDVDGGGSTADALYIYDNWDTLASTYTVTRDSVVRTSSAPISYDASIDRLNLYGGGPYESYNVESTAAGVATSITGAPAPTPSRSPRRPGTSATSPAP